MSDEPLVKVTWTDSGCRHGESWSTIPELVAEAENNDMKVVSVGYLIHRDEKHVILAQSYDETHGHYVNAQQIWAPSVVTIEYLYVGGSLK